MKFSKTCLKINRRLLPVKLHYFLFNAALACALPFRTVFAKQLGISATELGVIFCAVPFLRTITNPSLGFILDYFKKFRLTITLILVTVAVSHLALIFIPPKSHNNLNITEKDFYTKVKFACHNETFPYVCDHTLLMYSEYRLTNDSTKNGISFVCDVECLDSTSGQRGSKERDTLQCNPKMRYDLKVLVHVSSCDIQIHLEEGEVIITEHNSLNSISVSVNNTSTRQFKSRISPFVNCSAEITTLSSFAKLTYRNASENTSANNQSYVIEAYDNGRKYASIVVPENMDNESVKYYVLSEYTMNGLVDDFISNSTCSEEFDCRTKKCTFRNQTRKDSNLEPFLEDEFHSSQFRSLFALFAISSVMFSAIMFMMDAVCYELLHDRKDQYGQQRMFGTIGWGMGALVGGFLNQIVPSEFGEIDYTLSFYVLAVVMMIDLIPIYQLKITDVKYSHHILKDVCFLFTKIDILYNLITVYIIGILSGFIWNYQFWFMQEIGSGQILLGLSQTFECLFELPCFVVSGWIINKIGHYHCNSITLLCIGIRYLCFAFMYNPWWTLAAGLFHGPTFGLFYASMTMYAKNEAPPGTEATVQALLHLAFEGVGAATGGILGGIGLDKFGSRMSFMYAAEIGFSMLFINLVATVVFSRYKINSKKIEQSSTNS